MITDVLLVAGGFLAGIICAFAFVSWENQAELDAAIRRHPTNTDDRPDWLD